jgi:hypothetical protein
MSTRTYQQSGFDFYYDRNQRGYVESKSQVFLGDKGQAIHFLKWAANNPSHPNALCVTICQ